MAQTTAYELAVIYQVDDSSALERVAGLIKKANGQVNQETTWEERDLAYPIKGQTRGVYTFYELAIPGPAINQLEAGLNITAGVIRHLFTRIDHKARGRAEAVAQRQTNRQQSSSTSQDETSSSNTASTTSNQETTKTGPK